MKKKASPAIPHVIIPLEKTGSLSKHGYRLIDGSASRRHAALNKAIEEFGTAYVIRKLSVLAVYRKNPGKNKRKALHGARAKENIKYVQKVRSHLSPQRRQENLRKTRTRIAAKGKQQKQKALQREE